MKGLLSPQIFYAPVSKCVQSKWKQYRPFETILCFSRWSRKRTPTASQKQKQIGLKILYFFKQISSTTDFEHLSHSIAFAWPNPYYDLWKNVFCLGILTTIKFEKNSVIGNLLRWTPFLICQTYSSPFFDYISIKKYLHPVVWGFAALWVQKNYKDRKILMKKIANLRKMATSFRRKNQQDERASEASDFLCTRLQMCTKHLETVSTLRNHFMFLQMVEKRDTNSLSETEANWTQNSIFSSNQFPVQEMSSILHIQSRLHDQAIT